LATVNIEAPASGSASYSIGDFGGGDQTVTYALIGLDSFGTGIAPGSFTVVAAIPEPASAALLVLVPLAALARGRSRRA
jgi:hypothetical protein